MIRNFPKTYINILGDKQMNKKYFHPLSIILTYYFSWQKRTIIRIVFNNEEIFDISEYDKMIYIHDFFNFEKFEEFSEQQKKVYLINHFLNTFKKLNLKYPIFTLNNDDEEFKSKFKLNNYYFSKEIIEKYSSNFDVKIFLLLGFNDFSLVCEIKNKITLTQYSMLLIRILPNVIRLNHIIGKLKWESKKEGKLNYYCSDGYLQFRINLLEKNYTISSKGNKEGLVQLINQIGKNFKERKFLRDRI